jgi:hypothetical protein
MENNSTNAKSIASLQIVLSPKLLQLHMHVALLSKNLMMQKSHRSNFVCEKYESLKKIKNENENENGN